MPSPFPGMDPFLEDPEVFPTLHGGAVVYLMADLQSRLPEAYYATTGARVWLERADRHVYPDVFVRKRRSPRRSRAGAATATKSPSRTRPLVVKVPQIEIREWYLDIMERREEGDRLVTSVEILSPSNKAAGGHGRAQYLQKQRETLQGQSHLVEIDLLRGGTHTTAVPLDALQREAGAFDYHVCVHRFDRFDEFQVYPISLEERLPEITIPLLPRDGTVTVDLQAVYDQAYDVGPFRKQIVYSDLEAIVPPLPPERLDWVRQRLRQAGLLPRRKAT